MTISQSESFLLMTSFGISILGDSKSYLSSLPRLCINVWAYFGGYFLALLLVQKDHHACPCINVLNVETEHRIGDRENFPLIQFSELSAGSVSPITHPRFHFNI